jgi:hypothetical protein
VATMAAFGAAVADARSARRTLAPGCPDGQAGLP